MLELRGAPMWRWLREWSPQSGRIPTTCFSRQTSLAFESDSRKREAVPTSTAKRLAAAETVEEEEDGSQALG